MAIPFYIMRHKLLTSQLFLETQVVSNTGILAFLGVILFYICLLSLFKPSNNCHCQLPGCFFKYVRNIVVGTKFVKHFYTQWDLPGTNTLLKATVNYS